MKRAKGLLWSILALAVALSLAVAAAVPVYAADAGLTKGVTPATPNEYELGDTIHYVMSIVNRSNVTGANENITVTAVWDVLPDHDHTTIYFTSPATPYTLGPGETQTYTYDWEATETGTNDTVTNTFYASGYQISTGGNDPFELKTEKSSVVHGREVGGTASLVNKLGLLTPWAVLLACAAVVTLLVLRKRRQA